MKFEDFHKVLRQGLTKAAPKQYLQDRGLFYKEFISASQVAFVDSSLNVEGTGINLLNNKGYLIFPSFTPSGIFSGYIQRSIDNSDKIKYLLPDNILFSKKTSVLGLKNFEDRSYCFVVENTIEHFRIKAEGFNSISLLGAYKSKFKLDIIRNQFQKGKLIFVTDNDKAGFELWQFAKEYLKDIPLERVEHQFKGLDEFFLENGRDEFISILSYYKGNNL